MRNNYISSFQKFMFLMLFFSQGLAAQNSNGSIQEPASSSSGKPKYTVTSTPKVDPSVKKSASGEVLVVSPESIKEQPTLSPDLRKHPELGMVKLEGSPNSIEEIALRNANSRTFKNADGSFTKQQTKGIFHYKDAQGYWRTIGQSPVMLPGGKIGIAATDLPILINTNTGATQMQLDRKGGALLFGEKALITYVDATGKVVGTLTAKEATSHVLSGNELTLEGMWPSIDRKQHITYYQLETDYILQNRPAVALPGGSMVFTENITLPAGWKIVEGRGEETAQGWEGSLEIVDQNGALKGRFDRLVFYDSNADVKNGGQALIGTYTYSQTGNKVTLGVVVPMDWLMDAKRQYPVTIDPTATNTYGNNGDLYFAGFNAACQEQMNVNVPAGTITGTATTYTVRAYLDAWRSEQRSRVGVGATWTATQNGTGNSNGSNNYSLTGQTIANGAHGGGNIAFTWQGFRTYLSFYDWFYCDVYTQELLSNTWVVTVTYTTTPCSGNPNAGTLAISAATGCSGSANYTLTSTGYTTTGSGLEYNFQHADAGTGTWVDLTGWVALGGSNPTYTTNTTVAKDYRIQYRCSGGAAQNSNTVTHTPVTCIYLNVNQQVQTTCAAKIYDSGGPSGNYANNEARVVIIYPTSSDQILTVSGSYATESGFDFISATDGVSSDISTYLNPYFNSGSGSFTISAPGPGIPLTIKFQSDGNTVGAGFDLNVSCSCAVPTAGTAVAQNIISCGETSEIYFSGAAGKDFYSFTNTSFVGNTLPSGATISGNATVTGEYVRLTSTATSQTGSLVFDNNNGLDGNQFITYFKIYAGGGSGADGMSFSFGPNISTTPGGSETGHGNGIKLSFDSYNNGAGVTPNCNGTNYSSVYLMYDNTVLGCYTTFNYTSWRNAWRLMVVAINENGQITVSNSEPGGPVYFNNVQLPAAYLSANKSTWKVAFSARTGGATDNHYVDDVNVYFGNQFQYSINNGSTWSNSATFTGLTAGTYNPIIRNKNVTCGNRALTAITIDGPPILPAIPTVSNNGPICAGGSVTLTSSGLAPGGKVASLTGTQTVNGNLVTAAVNSFTMEFWVKPTATRATTTQSNTGTIGTSAQRYAINPAFGNTDAGAGVSVGTDGISVFEHGAGYLPSTLVYDFQTPKTEWMHVAVVYNNRIPTLYINGVFVKTGVVSARSNVYPSSGTGSSYGYYNGQLDNIRIWNDVRTSAEIRANMNIEVPANNTGLVARYDFNASNVNASFGSPNNTNGGATFVDASYYTYTWSGTNAPAATTSETVNVSSPSGNYTVNYNTSNNCGSVNGGSTAVTVNAIPTAAISGTQTICAGGSSTFTASGGGTYAWSTGATTAAINVTTAGTYTVTVTNSGCTATASRALTVTPLPTAAISGTQTICAGGSSTFTASGGGTYAWSTGATTAAINVTTAGTYTVTVTNSGCTATASRALTVTPLPTAAISGTQTICAGGSSTFTASGGGTYAWSTGATTAAINVTAAGTYTVTVTNSGCTALASRTLTVNAIPTVGITPASPSVCNGASTTLTASGGVSYAWSTGSNIDAATVTPSSTTSYTVTVTGSNGCTATGSKSVTVTQLTISGGTFQSGDYVFSGTTSASWAVAGNWYQHNGTSFVLASAVPATTNNIFVYPTTASTCIVRNTVNLAGTNNGNNVNIMPGATINGTNNSRTINVYGNWTNDGTFTMGNSTVAFRGSANTTTSAGASSFYNLTINKSTTGALVEFLESFSCTEDFLVTQGTVQIPQDVVGQAEDISIQAAGALVLKQKTSGTKGGELRVTP